MERIGFAMRLLPGREAEYRRRHAAVWPEMLAELQSGRRADYSIFLRGEDLFGYLVVDDFAPLPSHDGCQRRSTPAGRPTWPS